MTDETWNDPQPDTAGRVAPDDLAIAGIVINLLAVVPAVLFTPEWIPIFVGLATASVVAGAIGEGLARGGRR